MAMNYHRLLVVGKLVSDPKLTSFANGGAVAKFGLPVDFTARKKNEQTGQWEGDSFIINVDVFNREPRKLADLVMQYLKKGSLVLVEGRLKNNEYTDKTGTKIARAVLVADNIQFLDPRQDGQGDPGEERTSMPAPRQTASAGAGGRTASASANRGGYGGDFDDEPQPRAYNKGSATSNPNSEDDIPF